MQIDFGNVVIIEYGIHQQLFLLQRPNTPHALIDRIKLYLISFGVQTHDGAVLHRKSFDIAHSIPL